MIRFFDANKKLLAAVGLVIFLAMPLVVDNKLPIHLAILGMLYAIVASNWDLTLGYAGVFNFAHLAFFQLLDDALAQPLALLFEHRTARYDDVAPGFVQFDDLELK